MSSQARPGPCTSRRRTWLQAGQRATTPGAWSNTRASAIGAVRPHAVQRAVAVLRSTRNRSWRWPVRAVPSVHSFEPVMAACLSVAPEALLAPGVAVVVIAQALPEAGLVLVQQLNPADPLGALPEVQVRHEQPRRAAMLGLQLLTVVAERDPGLVDGQVLQRQIAAVAAVRLRQREAGAGLHPSSRVSSDTPSQLVPSLDQWVTQWMSTVIGSLGRLRKAAQSQRCWSPVSLEMVNSHSARSMSGVGPADRTGKSSTRYWPGGSPALGRRRFPLNPRETVPIVLSPFVPVARSAIGGRPLPGWRWLGVLPAPGCDRRPSPSLRLAQ